MRFDLLKKLFVVLTFFLFSTISFAEEEKKPFNAGDMIMHHVLDAHEIHFLTLGAGTENEKHITLPLPIILYTSDNGFELFSSSKFHNPDHKHNRYILHHEHIYIANENGMLDMNAENHPINITPLDLSITKTVFGILLVCIILLFLFIHIANAYKKSPQSAPKGIQSFIEPIIYFVRDEIAKPSIGRKHERFMPYLLSVFFFILTSNLIGLIPFIGGFNITGNITITMVLALLTFLITTLSTNKGYWVHIVNTPGVPWWLKFPVPLMPVIELIGVFSKPMVLMLRLFANITAGHIIILSFVSLIFIFADMYGAGAGLGVSVLSLVFAIFMNLLELLVAFLQAYIFTLLSALYFGMAVEEHH